MEIDYKLKIKGEKTEHVPRQQFIKPLIDSNSKIFEIKAGNGFGKTFLLNLIAYAFYADKLGNDSILKTLKDRVSDYSNQDAYNLEYKLSFDLPNGKKIRLSKESDSDRIVQFDNQSPIGDKNLHKSVSILYDVPVDPSLRLNEVIKDLRSWNTRLRDKVIDYYNILSGIESQFSSLRDEEKIKSYLNKEVEYKNDELSKNSILKEVLELDENLNIYSELEKLISEQRRKKSIESDFIKKQKEFKTCSMPKKIDKKDEELIKNLQLQLKTVKNDFKIEILKLINAITDNNELKEYINNDNSLNRSFSFLNENDIDSILKNEDFVGSTNNFLKKLYFLADGTLKFIDSEESGKKYIVHNFLTQLLEQIDELIENGADGILEVLTKNNTNILKKEIENRILDHKVVNYRDVKFLFKNSPELIKNLIAKSMKLSVNIL